MALALERDVGTASQSEVCDWLRELAGELLEERAAMLQELRRQADRVGKGGTRRIPPARASAAADANSANPERTRAAASAAQEVTRAVTSDEAPLAARSRTRRRRPRRSLLLLLALLAPAGLASAYLSSRAEPPASAGLASGLHEARPMPIATGSNQEASASAGEAARSADAPETPTEVQPEAAHSAAPAGDSPGTAATKRERKAKREASSEPEPAAAKARGLIPVRSTRPRDCTQPYEIDRLGIRRWKRECL
jgi:hypothetical protein